MLKSLLVPLDGSKFSESSLPLAATIARATGAKLQLAHVHEAYEPEQLLANTPFHFEGVSLAEYDAHQLEREKEYAARLAGQLEGTVPCVEARVLEGGPVADRIAEHALEVGADMIFIASHGHSGVSRFWLGSVADGLVRHATVPVMVVRPNEEGEAGIHTVRHILVPLDGSDLAEGILGPASELAKATGARVTLGHVISVVTVLGPRILPVLQEELEPELDRASEYLEGVAAGLREAGLHVGTHAAHGKAPPLAIAEMATELGADVIALGTHGYGGLRRSLLGSVADKLLRTSSLPVLVARPTAAA